MVETSKPLLATLLREQTRVEHQALDHHPLLASLVRPSVTLGNYASALAALHGVYASAEGILSGFVPENVFPKRTPDIEADLKELGSLPFSLRVPLWAPATPAEKVGMMYVIEGSNLGGEVIAKCLLRSFPGGVPMQFFGRTNGTRRWQCFWQFALQQCPVQHHQQAIDAARRTFAFIREHLDSLTVDVTQESLGSR